MVEKAVRFIERRMGCEAGYAMILGSGLGGIADELDTDGSIPYDEIPGFPEPGFKVRGHGSEVVYGTLSGKQVLVFTGRFHFYQGYSMQEVTIPVRVARRLGVHTMIITNACGGINENFKPGDIMLIADHINLMGGNPLIGIDRKAFGSPFVDMSDPYDRGLRECVREIAADKPEIGSIREGTYVAVHGPCYETKAEISFYRRVGGDAVGMSTVPEVIVCAQEGIRVLGLSAVSNMATGVQQTPLSHQEVLDGTARMSDRLILLIKELFDRVLS
jgi:purine-nucleoside phosphorylase